MVKMTAYVVVVLNTFLSHTYYLGAAKKMNVQKDIQILENTGCRTEQKAIV